MCQLDTKEYDINTQHTNIYRTQRFHPILFNCVFTPFIIKMIATVVDKSIKAPNQQKAIN